MRRTILLAAFLLAACQGKAPDPPPPPAAAEPATTVSDFSQDMTARGNEPFWSLRMQGTRFTLARPGQPEVVFAAPGATIIPGRATWMAKAADGRTLAVTLYVSDCSDGMSDLRYPMSAELTLAGQSTLSGCATMTRDLGKMAPRP